MTRQVHDRPQDLRAELLDVAHEGAEQARPRAGAVDLLELATTKGVLLPARLRIDQRSSLKDGQTKRYGVPTLDIDVRPLEMHAITRSAAEGEVAATGQPLTYTPVAALGSGVSVAEGLAAANGQTERREHARSSAPIGEVAEFEFDEPVPVPAESSAEWSMEVEGEKANIVKAQDNEVASTEQQRLLMATAREAGISDARRYDLTEQVCGEGIRSVKRVPRDKVDELLAAFNAPASLSDEDLYGKVLDYARSLDLGQEAIDMAGAHMGDRDWLEKQLVRLKQRYEESQAPA